MCSENQPDFGFNSELITDIYSNVGLSVVKVASEFSLTSEKGTREVIMAIGKMHDKTDSSYCGCSVNKSRCDR